MFADVRLVCYFVFIHTPLDDVRFESRTHESERMKTIFVWRHFGTDRYESDIHKNMRTRFAQTANIKERICAATIKRKCTIYEQQKSKLYRLHRMQTEPKNMTKVYEWCVYAATETHIQWYCAYPLWPPIQSNCRTEKEKKAIEMVSRARQSHSLSYVLVWCAVCALLRFEEDAKKEVDELNSHCVLFGIECRIKSTIKWFWLENLWRSIRNENCQFEWIFFAYHHFLIQKIRFNSIYEVITELGIFLKET